MTTIQKRIAELQVRGFDKSRKAIGPGRGLIKVGCSQCAAVVINGVACHETGCPNMRGARYGSPAFSEEVQ